MTDRDLKPANITHPALAVVCRACNAKPGEPCGNLLDASKVREIPHRLRIKAATEAEKNRS